MVSAVCLSLLAAPGLAFVRTPFVAEQVRHAPVQTARSTAGARTSPHMVATPDKVGTGVKRNENFAKLKVGGSMVTRVLLGPKAGFVELVVEDHRQAGARQVYAIRCMFLRQELRDTHTHTCFEAGNRGPSCVAYRFCFVEVLVYESKV